VFFVVEGRLSRRCPLVTSFLERFIGRLLPRRGHARGPSGPRRCFPSAGSGVFFPSLISRVPPQDSGWAPYKKGVLISVPPVEQTLRRQLRLGVTQRAPEPVQRRLGSIFPRPKSFPGTFLPLSRAFFKFPSYLRGGVVIFRTPRDWLQSPYGTGVQSGNPIPLLPPP